MVDQTIAVPVRDRVSLWRQSATVKLAGWLIVATAIATFLGQLALSNAVWTPVGYVDVWALWDRYMKFDAGAISLDHYLLDPFVHPHLIVFLLYLADIGLAGGRQIVPHLAMLASIVAFSAALIYALWRTALGERWHAFGLSVLAGTVLLTSAGISEATTIPFQTVVECSRTIYLLLLLLIIWSLHHGKQAVYIVSMAIAVASVPFYASGNIFALEIIIVHLLPPVRWRLVALSFLPFVAYLALVHYYMSSLTPDLASIPKVLETADLSTVWEIILSTAAYYACFLVAGWPFPMQDAMDLSMITLLMAGSAICVWSGLWTLWTLWCAFRARGESKARRVTDIFMAMMSLWVFISAVGASLLWEARILKLNMYNGTMSPHYASLTSTRYSVYASLALIVVLYSLWQVRRTWAMVAMLPIFVVVEILSFRSVTDPNWTDRIASRDALNVAGAGILTGIDLTDQRVSAAGPLNDWYWGQELPKVVIYLEQKDLAFARGLPQIGASVGDKVLRATIQITPSTSGGKLCDFTGPKVPAPSTLLAALFGMPRRLVAVADDRNVVVGYGAITASGVRGYARCDADKPSLVLPLKRWHE